MEKIQEKSEITIELNKVPIQWELDKGNLTFFGIDSALFWTDPSISNMLAPIVDELGMDLFRLLVAYSSSLGTEADYHAMISTLATNFKDGFLSWGKAVSAAGWGSFEILEYNPIDRQAVVIVKNPWELSTQKNLQGEKRWGAPFLQGKLIGIFSHAFKVPCWANDTCYFDAETPYVEIRIFQSGMTIMDELKKLRQKRMLDKERELTAMVDLRTIELQQAKDEIEKYSVTLEQKVEERTANLVDLNIQLEQEIKIRKNAEAKLEELNRELLELSFTDKLTGIANRRRFDTVLLTEWSRALRSRCSLCLIIGDVDWFKKYNDSYGHQAGDNCLQLVANVLQRNAKRVSDLVARYGGEEFALILPITDGEQAKSIVEKIIMDFRDLNIPHSLSEYGHVTMSFGIAVVVPRVDQTVELFLKAADDALYSAKKEGRNKCVMLNYDT
ncbi:diguanylate cyclase [Trichlorobacter lovleyi]|uniref:GGDEF domain-containing protein n=1 Tax=Trichlorobacter lovleyi TaxID=313985 RepID=UPI00223FEF2F|nr:GGDEF domain-containing protein [Trichlorobacter lovleyi]QOX77468.1 diguanylate cyclase [Trichlorobacter lovleyi]